MAKIAAWSSWAEFDAVYHQLVSPDPQQRAQGVTRVETWRSRSRLPVAVDVTASFVEIMLNDSNFNPGAAAPRSDHELRLMYAMAAIRLVNGIVDVSQRGGKSILSRAQNLEWPQWFVDIRHTASHMQLPTLPLLRLAAQEALWLLVERFWRPQLVRLGERGGRLAARAAPAGTGRAPERTRGAKTLDRRLRTLVDLTAAAGDTAPGARKKKRRRKLKEDAAETPACEADDTAQTASAQAAAAGAEDAARELAELAPDEGRLLARTIAVVMAGEPHADGREVRALELLCESCSDNFALRMARQILGGALALPKVALDAASDNSPSLRNISDACMGFGCSGSERSAAPCALAEDAVSGEPERMLRWLQAMLKSDRGKQKSRARRALVELLPLLRHSLVERLAEATVPDLQEDLAARALAVWSCLQGAGLDAGAALFTALCRSLQSTGMDAQPRETSCQNDTEGLAKDVEEFLRKRKFNADDVSKGVVVTAACEPWTAVGTMLDPKTLAIRCRREQTEGPVLPDGAVSRWLDWAATENSEGDASQSADGSVPADAQEPALLKPPAEDIEEKETALPSPGVQSAEDLAPLTELEPVVASQAITAADFRRLAADLVKQAVPLPS